MLCSFNKVVIVLNTYNSYHSSSGINCDIAGFILLLAAVFPIPFFIISDRHSVVQQASL